MSLFHNSSVNRITRRTDFKYILDTICMQIYIISCFAPKDCATYVAHCYAHFQYFHIIIDIQQII